MTGWKLVKFLFIVRTRKDMLQILSIYILANFFKKIKLQPIFIPAFFVAHFHLTMDKNNISQYEPQSKQLHNTADGLPHSIPPYEKAPTKVADPEEGCLNYFLFGLFVTPNWEKWTEQIDQKK